MREFSNFSPPALTTSCSSNTLQIYAETVDVIGDAPTPYAAALGLEQWFRNTGGFTYEEQPDAPSGDQPPLAEFVLEGRRGYCQHYAGSMALMMRLLGVPARVAAGFVPGDYNEELDQWTVTDRDAHTWVEVWFPGFGWLPFDPTPGRGELVDTYSHVVDRLLTRGGARGRCERCNCGQPGSRGDLL